MAGAGGVRSSHTTTYTGEERTEDYLNNLKKEMQVGLVGKGKRDTNSIGAISESAITTRFLQLGYIVLTPHGGNQRYDLVVEDIEGHFWRVQCKTAWFEENETVLKFKTANHNINGRNRNWRHYRGQCDYFAAYCEKLNKVYLLPVDEVGTNQATLRLEPAKNSQEKNVRWAKDYEF
ncbi:MAG TPA: group I intron-associated PD-(D/E)XK endonuclease [Ktedonobacteraceae bacterium]|nr:group I intron-associated PD-(D/E)XK endonuclease [Ktedonobacteraceae bacterium]